MTIEEWENTANIFNEIDSEFLMAYSDYQYGNKKDKTRALNKINQLIDSALFRINNNKEVYDLYSAGSAGLSGLEVSNTSRIFQFEDFKDIRRFSRNMNELQKLISEKVKILSNNS